VAFVALSAVVTLPGGINTPLIWLMNMEPHCVELITVIFVLELPKLYKSAFLSMTTKVKNQEHLIGTEKGGGKHIFGLKW
jgi:hypothetical protein